MNGRKLTCLTQIGNPTTSGQNNHDQKLEPFSPHSLPLQDQTRRPFDLLASRASSVTTSVVISRMGELEAPYCLIQFFGRGIVAGTENGAWL
jgi:hypothetical protein